MMGWWECMCTSPRLLRSLKSTVLWMSSHKPVVTPASSFFTTSLDLYRREAFIVVEGRIHTK